MVPNLLSGLKKKKKLKVAASETLEPIRFGNPVLGVNSISEINGQKID